MRTGILICVAVVLGVVPVVANEAAVTVVGPAVHIQEEHPDVRMLSARIIAQVEHTTSSVRCEYELKNEGPSQLVTLGFRDELGLEGRNHLTDFRSRVDGKPVKVQIYETFYKGEILEKRWYVRRVQFARGQVRHIVNTYQQPHHFHHVGNPAYFPYTIWPAGSWKGTIKEVSITAHWAEPYLWVCQPPPVQRCGNNFGEWA